MRRPNCRGGRPCRPLLARTSEWVLAVVFAAFVVLKVGDSEPMERQFEALRVVGVLRSAAVVAEALIALLLLSPWSRGGIAFALAFCAVSVVYLSIVRWAGLDVEGCGCFGARRVEVLPHFLVIGSVVLLCLASLSAERRASAEGRP